MNQHSDENRLDLLIQKATSGLTEAEQHELDRLLAAADNNELLSFELTAAAIAQAEMGDIEQIPANLRSRITADAERYFDALSAATDETPSERVSDRGGFWAWFGWAVAAAACVALAANIWITRIEPDVANVPAALPTPEQLTVAQMRDRFIESAGDIARVEVGAGNVKDVQPRGDIIWSDSKQAGYIRISGLPKNDPNRETYQLWIIDSAQDPKTPIDGGIFDISAEGEVIIPIDAKIAARDPKAFAITVERPGGVVVSKQERVVALAKRAG